MVELVTSWAPLVFLHSQEVFYPSEVEFFLPEVTLNDGDNNVVVDPVTPQNMPAGRSDLHLQTRQPLGKLLTFFSPCFLFTLTDGARVATFHLCSLDFFFRRNG